MIDASPLPTAAAPPDPVVLDGDTLTARHVALIAREGAEARLSAEARGRNDVARTTIETLLDSGVDLYGVSTGVGALRERRVEPEDRGTHALSLLRSHAGGAGAPLRATLVRAAMATRANQIAVGGAGVGAAREPARRRRRRRPRRAADRARRRAQRGAVAVHA
jgi:histidine ammonia-lyase